MTTSKYLEIFEHRMVNTGNSSTPIVNLYKGKIIFDNMLYI